MKLKYFLFIILTSTMMVGCSVKTLPNKVTEISSNITTSRSITDNSNKSFVIRAERISKFRNIIVTPSGEEMTGQLGADSLYGKSSDFTFNADYNIIFKDLSNNEKVIGKIEKDSIAVIIQPKSTPIKMQKLLMNKNEVFIFIS